MASMEHHVAEEATELKAPSPGERYPQPIDEKNRKGSISTEVDTEFAVYFEEGDEVELRESDYTPEQYKKLLRNVDKFLLPLMCCCYGIQQTDKTSLGTQALFGLREDTGLVGQQYKLLTTIGLHGSRALVFDLQRLPELGSKRVYVRFYTRKAANRRMLILTAATIPPFVGLLALFLLPQEPSLKWTKWGLFLMTVPTVLSLFLAWTLIPSNVAGRTKKTIISSATFLGYCVGNMVGSQIFKTKDAPQYVPGTIGASVCLGLEFVCIVAWRGWYMWQNSKRDRAAAESGITKGEQERLGREMGEQDVTDLRNPYFRYTM